MKATRRVLDARDSTPTIRTNLPCIGQLLALTHNTVCDNHLSLDLCEKMNTVVMTSVKKTGVATIYDVARTAELNGWRSRTDIKYYI